MAKIDKVQEVAVSLLKPYEKNAKKHGRDQIEKLKASIREFGFLTPCLIDQEYNLIAGHGRVEAAKEIGMKQVPCVFIEGLTEAQRRAYILADNRLGELGEWDMDIVTDELFTLDALDFDITVTGFDLPEEPESTEVVEDDFTEEVENRCKLGDVWQLGDHRLICEDSTDPAVIDRLMDGVKADMVFTDPPYNVAFNGRSGKFDVIENDDLDEDSFRSLITASCSIIRTLEPKAYYVWCNWKFYGILQELLDFKSCIVWAKNVFGMGKGYRHQHEFCLFNGTIDEGINNESDLWEVAKDTNYVHPTQKPVALCARALKNHKNAKAIVDLFGGSGSTLIACEQLGRKCYMCELDPHYCDVIINRWETLTGREAVLING